MTPEVLTCAEVDELAGVYVLGALEPGDERAVREHLETCPAAHAEIAELGPAVPALALSAEPAGAPAALKRRVLDAYREAQPLQRAAGAARPASAPRRAWLGWAAAATALMLVVVLGGAFVTLRAENDRLHERVAHLEAAISMLNAPDAQVAMLHGMDDHADAAGFAAFDPRDGGYVVIVGLEPAPSGMTYQAWYMAGGEAHSAGLLEVGTDGYAMLADMQPMAGAEMIELTMEPGGGSAQPTGAPVVMGAIEARG